MKDAIVIVDDEPGIAYLLKRELSRLFVGRFTYETALSAREALQVIETLVGEGTRIILILSDWLMPEVRGDEFLRLVHERYPDIRAILISGYADPEAVRAVRAQVPLQAVLGKPWDKEVLKNEVMKCLEETRL